MSCGVAVSNSPVFSPSISSSLFSSRSCFSSNCPSISGSKRKRPAKLDIPMVSPAIFGPPVTGDSPENDVVDEEIDGFYSVYCKRGRRAAMEDRFSAVIHINGNPDQIWMFVEQSNIFEAPSYSPQAISPVVSHPIQRFKAFFGVFDGHGGVKAAEYAANNINKNIMAEIITTDDENLSKAVKNGYLKTDSDFLKQDLHGGSCCVTALITNGNLVVSNAGDCRAVISRGGVAEALTVDHRPSRQEEKDRIEAKGGYIDCYNGVWRIQGSLAVSRAIGNGQLKQWIIAEPETKIVRIRSDDEFLILASDGLWDKVTNQEAVDIARSLCPNSNKLQAVAACKKLVDLSVSRGSLDDVSVMLIQLKRYMQ